MKQMRSRFRLLTLLLVCAFVLALALCTGSVLKAAGISLSSLSSVSALTATAAPDPSLSPDALADPEPSPASPELSPAENSLPEPDNSADPEYNTFGL